MDKRKIFNLFLFGLFVVYLPLAINWPNYLENNSMLLFLLFLALIIIIFSIKIIMNKKNDAATKVAFSFVLLCTIGPIIFPFILLFGLWLNRP
ncbi:MAG: hypothetical protein RR470_04370 [Vagococcus sp.]|uniref:hypothetical protein n=1 Tax=Vagococcus sp. TaxID=1933889 RepID=UPI002FCC6670